jgi:hypothetical protein
MIARWYGSILVLLAILFAASSIPGCMEGTIGSVRYEGTTLVVPVTYSGSPSPGLIQVTVNSVHGLSQAEQGRYFKTFSLGGGSQEIGIPLELPPGRYKIYVYLTADSRREAGVIYDLVVP